MSSLPLVKIRPLGWFCLLLAGLAFTIMGLLRAQDDSGGTPPSGTETPAQDQGSPGQSPGFSSDDATGATQGDASFQTFYDALSSQGTWIQSGDYGYVWQPQVNDPNWSPYTQGYWVYTDAGWTWVSDEQFGWATYHYGRWVNLDGYGWVWVPGYTWAPAWVSWRYGDGYVGWAPLPPDSLAGVDYQDDDYSTDFGYHIGGDCDDYYGIGAGIYIFLPANYLCYHNYHGHYCNRYDNWSLIGHTANVTNINVTRGHGTGNVATDGDGRFHHVTVGGPKLAEINAVSSLPMQKVSLTRSSERGGGTLNGSLLALYAPHINASVTGAAPLRPSRISGLIGQAKINRGTNILNPPAVNSHLAPQPATETQVQQARIAASQTPATAKVLTDDSSVKPVLQRPLPAMRPVVAVRSGNTEPATTPGATYHSVPAPEPSQSYTPARIYPQAGGSEPAPSHVYSPAPVYPSNPTYPSHVAPSEPPSTPGTYAPTTVYPTNPSSQPRSVPPETGGGSETHTYVRPVAPAYAAPLAPVPSGSTPSSSSSSGTVPAGSGSSGATSGGGSSGGRNR